MSELLAKLLPSDDALLDGVGAHHAVPAHLRSAAQQALESSGFPHLKTEAWKYTSLRRVETWDFHPDVVDHTAVQVMLDEYFSGQLPQRYLIFAGGQYLAGLSRADDNTPSHSAALTNSLAKVIERQRQSEDAFVNLCLATTPHAWSIELHKNNEPLHLVYLPAQPGQESNNSTLDQLYLHLNVTAQEKCSVIEHYLHDSQGLSNYCTHIELSEGAQLSHGRRVLNSDRSAQISRTELDVAANARYELAEAIHHGMLVRHEARVYFNGVNGHASVSSAARLTGKARLDQDWLMIHEANHCKTEQNFRAAVDDHSSASFTGRAKITERIAGSVVPVSYTHLRAHETR